MPEKFTVFNQDRTQRIVVTAIYELPPGGRSHWDGHGTGFGSRIISGWQVSGIYQGRQRARPGLRQRHLRRKSTGDIPLSNSARTTGPLVQRVDPGIEKNSALQLSPEPAGH
jgi:hypothetical protein